ncbi:hypothetical protein GUJ93_ZPchr0006g41437 [Zizania palustris]|uniref:Uncharacterized protein n=1 Tax=Zizania palustris TaxID=103762 RepID=A0A8J5SN21_ZIZPA|nr:hypothetical protein GUJ93_ZPchr0006g41437 [Zizania palustris]
MAASRYLEGRLTPRQCQSAVDRPTGASAACLPLPCHAPTPARATPMRPSAFSLLSRPRPVAPPSPPMPSCPLASRAPAPRPLALHANRHRDRRPSPRLSPHAPPGQAAGVGPTGVECEGVGRGEGVRGQGLEDVNERGNKIAYSACTGNIMYAF